MCLQCMTEAVNVLGKNKELLPANDFDGPWFLMKAVKDHKDWPAGWYGLVRYNDPDFVFKSLPEKGLEEKDVSKWCHLIHDMEEEMRKDVDIMSCYMLVASCIMAGFKPGFNEEDDGFNVVAWLADYIIEKMNRKGKRSKKCQ